MPIRSPYRLSTEAYFVLESRKPSSPFAEYQAWKPSMRHSKMTKAVADRTLAEEQRMNGRAGWEYRLVPFVPPAPPKRVPPTQTLHLRPGSLRPALEEVDTEYLEALAAEAAAEAGRRKLRAQEAAESKERERQALWMRVHGKAALQGWQNFMAGVVQAMASRAVLRWSQNHKPYGGSTASSGEMWTDEEIYAAEQLCYARGHVPPWHLDAAKATEVLRSKAGLGREKPRPATWPRLPADTLWPGAF